MTVVFYDRFRRPTNWISLVNGKFSIGIRQFGLKESGSGPYLFLLTYSLIFLIACSHVLEYWTTGGRFFDLGIRYLLDSAYLSSLFPPQLYCYGRNAKGIEIFEDVIPMSHNGVFSKIWLIFWFWTAFALLICTILLVQGLSFGFSTTYRFKRLQQLLPWVDEQMLRQFSTNGFDISVGLEMAEFIATKQDFQEFLSKLFEGGIASGDSCWFIFMTSMRKQTKPDERPAKPGNFHLTPKQFEDIKGMALKLKVYLNRNGLVNKPHPIIHT